VKILVPLKRVADPNNANKVKVAPDGSSLSTEGLEPKMNPYDEYALEAALRLTENGKTKQRVGEVVVVSIGGTEVEETARKGLSMGAERAVVVQADETQLDARATAAILAKVVEREQPDLVLMGKLNVETESTAAGAYLATKLGWPLATQVMRIVTGADGGEYTVEREVDGGVLTLKVGGPAVFTVSDRILHPTSVRNGVTPEDFEYPALEGGRYPTMKNIVMAKKKPMDRLTLGDLGVEPQAATRIVRYAAPPARDGETVFVESVQDLVRRLHEEAKVI